MRVLVLAVGKLKERGLREAVDDYSRRIARYARFEEQELKDGVAAELEARFARAIPERSRVVALEVDGESWSSDALARQVGRCEAGAVAALVFLVGGADGLPPEVSRRADAKMSLSAMTLPHRLARLVLVEQIYRAFTILRGEPYPR